MKKIICILMMIATLLLFQSVIVITPSQFAYADIDFWSNWTSLGGYMTGDPAIVGEYKFIRGGKDIVSAATSGAGGKALWYKTTADWKPLDGYMTSQMTVGRNLDGRLEVFAARGEHALWHIYQLSPNSDSWSNWTSLGGYMIGDPAVAEFADGRLAVFVVGGFFDAYYKVQLAPNSANWSDWIPIGGYITSSSIAVARDADGRLELFARGGDNQIYTNMQTAPNSNTWTGWISLGGFWTSDPSVAMGPNGRLNIFAVGSFFDGYYQEQMSSAGGWSDTNWKSLNGYITSKMAAVNFRNEMYVFARGGDNSLWYGMFHPNGWSGWRSLGGYITSNIEASSFLGGNIPRLLVYAGDGAHGLSVIIGEPAV